MACSRSTIVLVPLLTAFALLASIIFFLYRGECPEGNFTCESSRMCVIQRSVCDGRKDCTNGEDEDPMLCRDLHGSFWEIVDSLNYKEVMDDCDLENIPEFCMCTDRTAIICKGSNVTEIPPEMPLLTERLIIIDNEITLTESSLGNMSLYLIFLSNNHLEHIPNELFKDQTGLSKVFIMDNNIKLLPTSLVTGLTNLSWLFLNNNSLENLALSSWSMHSLIWLDLSRNNIKLGNECFSDLPSLRFLNLDWNMIEEINESTFKNLISLEDLSLGWNRIQSVHYLAFVYLKELKDLNLKNNFLILLHDNIFMSQSALNKLDLSGNVDLTVSNNLFKPLISLKSLALEDIEIADIERYYFDHLKHLDFVYFKRFKYCIFVPHVLKCRPLTDGTSSSDNLLANDLLRSTLWIVALFTLIANVLVLWRRLKCLQSGSPLNIIITNLSFADSLMAIYLIVIGIQDSLTRGIYRQKAAEWTSSMVCTALGMTAMISCESSILILLLISVERFMLISAPLSSLQSLKKRAALLSTTSIWLFSSAIAALPVFVWKHSMRFYGMNSICFPLHIDEPYLAGWQYSAFVFLGINSLGLISIGLLYVGVFVSIWKTRRATTLKVRDTEFAFRFFCIIIANASCWVPIIVLKILAFMSVSFSRDIYGWIGVFVLPVNSAINPILYTFTTPSFRRQQLDLTRSPTHQENQPKMEPRLGSNGFRTWSSLTRKRPSQYAISTPKTTEEEM